jgi:hypothetical protein
MFLWSRHICRGVPVSNKITNRVRRDLSHNWISCNKFRPAILREKPLLVKGNQVDMNSEMHIKYKLHWCNSTVFLTWLIECVLILFISYRGGFLTSSIHYTLQERSYLHLYAKKLYSIWIQLTTFLFIQEYQCTDTYNYKVLLIECHQSYSKVILTILKILRLLRKTSPPYLPKNHTEDSSSREISPPILNKKPYRRYYIKKNFSIIS